MAIKVENLYKDDTINIIFVFILLCSEHKAHFTVQQCQRPVSSTRPDRPLFAQYCHHDWHHEPIAIFIIACNLFGFASFLLRMNQLIN